MGTLPSISASLDDDIAAQSVAEVERLRRILGSALNMLELIASKMPAGAKVRNAIEAECAAMRSSSAARAVDANGEGVIAR